MTGLGSMEKVSKLFGKYKQGLFAVVVMPIVFYPGFTYSQPTRYANIVEGVKDCVVSLVAMKSANSADQSDAAISNTFARGTGMTLSDNGYIVTNNHIVTDADRYFVEVRNGFVYEAEFVGGDAITDLAVIKIENNNLSTCEFDDSNAELEIGQFVLGIGSPFSLTGSVAEGIISYLDRPMAVLGEYTDYVLYIQTDMITNPGNSGGALIDLQGRIIGMNSATVLSNSGASSGISFAIPSRTISRISRQLIRDGYSEKGYIGLQVSSLPQTEGQIQGLGLQQRRGALVSGVELNSPAYKAGIREGDIVVTVNREVAEDEHKFRNLIGELEGGDSARLSLIRAGTYFSVEVPVEGRLINPPN